jgi:AcrR family transcriptional regulator
MTELCDAVGLGRGNLYYYIGSKEQLLGWIHDRVMDELLNSATETLAQSSSDPANRLRALGADLLRIIAAFPDHVWVFLHEWPALSGDNATEFRRKRHEYEDLVEGILREGVAEGTFEIADVKLTVLAWLGLHNYTYQWFRQSGRLDPQAIADAYHTLFMTGIALDPDAILP